MTRKKSTKGIVYKTLVLVVGGCLLCILVSGILLVLEIRAWHQLGERLGIEPTLDALDAYIHSHIWPGMSRDEVQRELDLITPTVTRPVTSGKPGSCEMLSLSIGPLPLSLFHPSYFVCYDLEGRLRDITISS